MKSLADIPQQPGFSLTGITWSGIRIPCVVVKNRNNSYSLRTVAEDRPIWSDLKGWAETPSEITV